MCRTKGDMQAKINQISDGAEESQTPFPVERSRAT